MQGRTHGARFMAALFAMFLVVSHMPGGASAAPPQGDLAALDLLATRLQAAGASQSAIDGVFAQHGLVRADAGANGEVTPLASSSNDIILGQPTIYYDEKKDAWLARATFAWRHNCSSAYYKSACEQKDCPLPIGSTAPCGGPDGFGLRVNHDVNEYLTHFYTYDVNGYQWTWSYPEAMNEYGASWTEQDSSTAQHAYNWDQGSLYYWFYLNGCTKGVPFKIYPEISHTWASTSVTGFSIFLGGFAITWSNDANHWQATAPGPTYWYPCG